MSAKPENETIVSELVALAQNDRSDPPNWLTDQRLQELERELIREKNDPTRFRAICFTAKVLMRDEASRTFFILGMANGRRRETDAMALEDAQTLLRVEIGLIENLEPSPRRERLMELWLYHSAIVAREQGRYADAAKLQQQAAMRAQTIGDKSTEAVSRFLVAWESFCHAVAMDTRETLRGPLYGTLNPQYESTVRILTETGKQSHWLFNASVHLLTACVLAEELRSVTMKKAMDATWRQLYDKGQGENWHDFYSAVSALKHYGERDGKREGTDGIFGPLRRLEDPAMNKDVFLQAMAKLLIARYSRDTDYKRQAETEYGQLIALPPRGIHMLRALARREMAALQVAPQ